MIVLVFWGTYSNTHELPGFGELARTYANDDRVAILGCFVAPSVTEARPFIAKHGMTFPHTADVKPMTVYDSSWPEATLVGRDGRIVRKHLRGETLLKFVAEAVDAPAR